MSSTAQHAKVWKPLVLTDFTCTCHKVYRVGEQPEQLFDPNKPYGPNMPKYRPYGPGMAAAVVIWFLVE